MALLSFCYDNERIETARKFNTHTHTNTCICTPRAKGSQGQVRFFMFCLIYCRKNKIALGFPLSWTVWVLGNEPQRSLQQRRQSGRSSGEHGPLSSGDPWATWAWDTNSVFPDTKTLRRGWVESGFPEAGVLSSREVSPGASVGGGQIFFYSTSPTGSNCIISHLWQNLHHMMVPKAVPESQNARTESSHPRSTTAGGKTTRRNRKNPSWK